MKMLVETTGQFQLQDMEQGNLVISAWRPTVVENSNFVQHRVALNQLKILGKLKDEAINEEFKTYLDESENVALAVASFMSSFGLEEFPTEPETKAERKARRKAEKAAAKAEGEGDSDSDTITTGIPE